MLEGIGTPGVKYSEVVGEPGYRVGDDGSAWSLWLPGGKMGASWHRLNPGTNSEGYRHIRLRLSGKQRKIHQLILEAFVGPCPPGMECRHLDGNPANNRLDNLAWGIRPENARDRVRHGTQVRPAGESNPHAILKLGDIPEVIQMHAEGMSRRKIASRFGVNPSTISRILSGKTWRGVG